MEKEKVNSFDVLKEMSVREMDIRLATLKNIIGVRIVGKGGQVTIAVNLQTAHDLLTKKHFAGGLILADEVQFNEVTRELYASKNEHLN